VQTLNELLTPKSRDAVLAQLIQNLQGEGFNITDWYEGGVVRTLLEAESAGVADLYTLVPLVAGGGFLDTASGAWLDLLAFSHYSLTRKPSVWAEWRLKLTNTGSTPYTVQASDLWAGTATGLRWQNTEGATIPAGGFVRINFKAESPGSAYNVAAGTVNALLTPLPFVSVTNEVGYQTVTGVDEETDAQLRTRARLRWAELGGGGTADAYRFWALSSDPRITQVRVLDQTENGRGQGTVDVIVWGDGSLDDGAVTVADAYIQARRPLTADVDVYKATAKVVSLVGTVYVKATQLATAQTQGLANLSALQRAQTIGPGTAYLTAIIDALQSPSGVRNVALTAPTGDTALALGEAVVFNTAGLVFSGV